MKNKISFLGQFGPGIIMASSAVGGSHIIASTQAGANYGFALGFFIIVVNLLKYPFYRFAFFYTLKNNQSVLDGYAQKGKKYLVLFLIFNLFATVVNIAGGALLSAALLTLVLPFSFPLTYLTIFVLVSFLVILRKQQYHFLDIISKNIMFILTIVTVIAFILAYYNTFGGGNTILSKSDFLSTPWSIASIPFLIALMGWMPSPMELSIASSLWIIEKKKSEQTTLKSGLFDFNVGYIVTIILALVFMGLGAFVQYGKGVPLEIGGKFIVQFVDMYAFAIGEWTRWFVGLLAFVCIYGTTIVAVDGYSRTNMVAINLLLNRKDKNNEILYWMLGASIISLFIILFFQSSVKLMIPFAMTMSFISAPIFAWLNFSLYLDDKEEKNKTLILWASIGLLYLLAMLILYFMVKFNYLNV